jgi:membrane protein implicated in regulation of membrane protease activity
VEIFLALSFLALIVGGWAFVMLRFQLRWWTILLTLLLLGTLFALYFRPEDEETDNETPVAESRLAAR